MPTEGKPGHLTIEEWLLAQNLDHMIELREQGQVTQRLKRTTLRLQIVTIVLVVVLFIICGALSWQVARRNERLDELERVTRKIEAIATEFQQNANEGDSGAVAEGLRKIDRICTALGC